MFIVATTEPTPNVLTDSGEDLPASTQPPPGRSAVKYPKFISADILQHLLRVGQGSDWSTLVALYLDYEVVSPSKSVSARNP